MNVWDEPSQEAFDLAAKCMAAIRDDDKAEWNRIVLQSDEPISEVLRANCVTVHRVLAAMIGTLS